ncbi:MAG: hypothetical protein OEV76_02160 [Anaerolineae bacterium]|nr:hypothetical protein [Anaerolineae bacterium]
MKFKVLAGAIAVMAVMLIASVAVAQYPGQGIGQGSSDIWVMNLSDTTSANVVASYVDQDGVQATSVGGTIAPLGNTSFPASTSGLGNDWLGSMVLYSDQPLASIAELYWQNVPKGDGWSGGSYAGYSEGANDLFFPYIMKTIHQRSIATIQCVDTVDCVIDMVYRDRGGNLVAGTYGDTIEPDSQESYDPWDLTLNPNVPSLPDGWFGALRVTSSQAIAGVVSMHWRQGYASAYNSFVPADDTEVYLSFIKRRNFGGSWGGNSDWSSIIVQNMANSETTVYLSFYDRTGGAPVLQFDDTIPALASQGYNTRYGIDGATPEIFNPLGTSFLGSAVVTSTDPIVAVCSTIRVPLGGLAGSYQGVPGGEQKLIFPRLYRTKNGGLWTGYSGLVVQNLDPNNSADVHLQFLRSNGTVAVEFDDTIEANASHGYNTRYDADVPASTFSPLLTNWSGPVIVTTSNAVGIVGITQDHVAGTGYLYHAMYNGLMFDVP